MPVPAPHPTFVIIGAARAATRWLRFNLDQHPDVCAPPLQLDYFSDPERAEALGFRWYRRQFQTHRGEPFVGECSPGYMAWNNQPIEVARRIDKALPDVRVIVILRNPVERFHSALGHAIRWGRVPPDVDIRTGMWEPDLIGITSGLLGDSLGFSCLYPFVDRMGDQVQVLFYDDIVEDPAAVYRAALTHIGADPDFVPADLEQVRYRDAGEPVLPPLTEDDRQILFQWFQADVRRLAEWSGRDLTAWDPGLPEGFEAMDFTGLLFQPSES